MKGPAGVQGTFAGAKSAWVASGLIVEMVSMSINTVMFFNDEAGCKFVRLLFESTQH
jgi:hypothetical protein